MEPHGGGAEYKLIIGYIIALVYRYQSLITAAFFSLAFDTSKHVHVDYTFGTQLSIFNVSVNACTCVLAHCSASSLTAL